MANGSAWIAMNRASASGPNHHVESPIVRAVFKTAPTPNTTPAQPIEKTVRHAGVSCHARDNRGWNWVSSGWSAGGWGSGSM